MRYVLSRIHLYLGLLSGLCIFVVAISGAVLVFRDNLEATFYPQIYNLQAQDSLVSLDSILKTAQRNLNSNSKNKWNYIELSPNPQRPIIISHKIYGTQDFIALNPYTAQLVSHSVNEDSFFPFLLRLHRYLALGKVGKIITGISAAIFLSLLITGIILLLPKKKHIKSKLLGKHKGQIYYKFHTLFGVLIYPLAMVIVLTGLCFAYKNFRSSLYYIFDGKAKIEENIKVNTSDSIVIYQNILAKTRAELPAPLGIIRIYAPDKRGVIKVRESQYSGRTQYVRNLLYFDRQAKLLRKELFSTSSTGEKLNRALYAIHTGSILSNFSKWLYLFTALIIASLPITGLAMFFLRARKKKHSKFDG